MKLDRELVRELKKANGDGTRATRFEFLNKVRGAAKMMSCTDAPKMMNEALKTYGRAVVACTLAATIFDRRDRLSRRAVIWATKILEIWTNHGGLDGFLIDDQLHPTKIEYLEYAGSFIQLTIEEE
ncbi:MAG: hypothetical protein ACI4MP_07255 [Candidatus Ventricola sp.]